MFPFQEPLTIGLVLAPPTIDKLSARLYSDFHSCQNKTLDIIGEQSDTTSSDATTSYDNATSSASDNAFYNDTMTWQPRRKQGESVNRYKIQGQYYTKGT